MSCMGAKSRATGDRQLSGQAHTDLRRRWLRFRICRVPNTGGEAVGDPGGGNNAGRSARAAIDRLEALRGDRAGRWGIRITQIIQGKRAITGDTALRLGHWFGTSPAFWMNLQSLYEVRLAEQQTGHEVASLPRRAGVSSGSLQRL